MNNKEHLIRPSLLSRWPAFMLAGLLVPVFGLGVWLILRLRRALRDRVIRVTDHGIRLEPDGRSAALPEIVGAEARLPWHLRPFKVGHVELRLRDGRHMVLAGLRDPSAIAEIILLAAERAREAPPGPPPRPPTHAPGSLEPLNDLVGLWQQGLITDEEYETERRRLERE